MQVTDTVMHMNATGLSYDQRVALARLAALLELLPTSLDKQLAPVGLTAFEFGLLSALADAPDHRLRLSALASRTNATLPRLSRVVTGLEAKGLVVRAACPMDGRATNAVLTEAGELRYRQGLPAYEGAVQSLVLADLSEADVSELARLSYLILARLDPDRRMAVTTEGAAICPADPAGAASLAGEAVPPCPADPPVRMVDDPPTCPADPSR
ncbi:Transcriptional regulator, MarR family [Micropruina glycogenica]|uniref:Transcriptional regulator, MarR family n=2 Tax=Micropruina glycogenica TaxID=75385 RepID=A0A2N9JH33_9ACTN|nr:Transcriptional regulator, MarR family [Micropruina glycogenica]